MADDGRSSSEEHLLVPSSQDEEVEDFLVEKSRLRLPGTRKRRQRRVCLLVLILGVATIWIGIGFIGGILVYTKTRAAQNVQDVSSACREPVFRREWRSLGPEEKADYIKAVQCLRESPSRLNMKRKQTLYDDFPWIHSRVGNSTHGTAAFVAWHRYFIHVYESALKEQCGYSGHLAYWDWTLDWEDISQSPIWDSESGFGGNGNATGKTTVGFGRCVTDGPFAHLTALFYDAADITHCLSRGFRTGELLKRFCSSKIRPEVIENFLRARDYESFNLELEEGAHRAIPNGIRGDFFTFSAPYDPVFFLHHTQLDRLWWRWQQEDPQVRLTEYVGTAGDGSGNPASLTDLLDFGALAPAVRASEVMSTESALLCYRY